MQSTADQRHLSRIVDIDFRPIFILGDHRSGTTLFYDMLRRTGAFNIVTAYHIIAYDQLLTNHIKGRTEQAKQALAERFEQLGIGSRRIDGVLVHPDLPEEYGFFLNQGTRLQASTLERFTEGCRKIQYISDPEKPLLLKNPWDYKHFEGVAQLFPQAPLLFVHRHPVEVINSRLRAARNQLASKSEYTALLSKRYEQLFRRPIGLFFLRLLFSNFRGLGARLTGRHVAKAASHYIEHLSELDRSRYMEIRYEDLCRRPNEIVGNILEFLGLHASNEVDFTQIISRRPSRPITEVERRLPRFADRLEGYCKRFGYSLLSDDYSELKGSSCRAR